MLNWHHTERTVYVSRGKGIKLDVFLNFIKVVQFDCLIYNSKSRKNENLFSFPYSTGKKGKKVSLDPISGIFSIPANLKKE